MNIKTRIMIPILMSSVALILSAFIVMTQATDTVDNINQTHTTETYESGGVT